MADILINDSGLLSEIKTTRGTNESIKALKYDINNNDIVLKSVDKYTECINALNELIKSFYELTEEDIHTLEIIRGEWIGLDASVSTKTVAGYTKDFAKSLFK